MISVERLAVGGAVLRLADALAQGRWVHVDLAHPTFAAPISTVARVAWCQTIVPGMPLSLVALEFVAPWDALEALRRAILGVQASVARAGDEEVGFVLREPDGSFTCHSAHTSKLAVVVVDGGQAWVRRREANEPASSFADALAQVFGRTEPLRLDPPLEAPGEGRKAAKLSEASGATPAQDEEEILAARTLVLDAARVRAAPAPSPEVDEEELLAARTVVLRAPRLEPDPDTTVALPKDRVAPREPSGPDRRYSKVLLGARFLGWVSPDSTGASWSIYDERRTKLALVIPEGKALRVCLMGAAAVESLEYIDAPSAAAAMAAAFDVEGLPRIEPPLARLG